MKRVFAITLFVVSLVLLTGCEGRLYGVITDKNTGSPIEGVNVSWRDEYVMSTNAAGEYDVPAIGGTGGFLKLEKAGYLPKTIWILVTGSHRNDYQMQSSISAQ